MRCRECRAELAALSHYELSSLDEPLREHILECSDCRRVHAALVLLEEGSSLHVEAPPDLAESISRRRPRTLLFKKTPMRVGMLAAVAALLLVVGSLAVRPSLQNPRQRAKLVEVHLSLQAPGARSVSVVGDWNGWKAGVQPMKRHDGTWEISIRLKPGLDYQYQFLINNDRWVPDPHAAFKVVNGFGGVNSVLAT